MSTRSYNSNAVRPQANVDSIINHEPVDEEFDAGRVYDEAASSKYGESEELSYGEELAEEAGIDHIETSVSEVDTEDPSEAYDQASWFSNVVSSARKEIMHPVKDASHRKGISIIDKYTPSSAGNFRRDRTSVSKSESLEDAFSEGGLTNTVKSILG